MATTGWRCPNCDTANARDARACSGCGRWPSLFDLESSESRYRAHEEFSTPPGADVEVLANGPGDVREPDREEDEDEVKSFRWGPVLTFAIAALFVLASWLSDRFGG